MATNPTVGMRLPTDVREWLRETAADVDITVGELVSRMVRSYVEGSEPFPVVLLPPIDADGAELAQVVEAAR